MLSSPTWPAATVLDSRESTFPSLQKVLLDWAGLDCFPFPNETQEFYLRHNSETMHITLGQCHCGGQAEEMTASLGTLPPPTQVIQIQGYQAQHRGYHSRALEACHACSASWLPRATLIAPNDLLRMFHVIPQYAGKIRTLYSQAIKQKQKNKNKTRQKRTQKHHQKGFLK